MSADLTGTVSRGVGSAGMPIGDNRVAGDPIIQLQTTETMLLGGGPGERKIAGLFFTNISGAAANVSVYLKPILPTTGLPDTAATKYLFAYQASIATTGLPVNLLPSGFLVVPRDYVLTALLTTGSNNAVNVQLSGETAR